MTSMPNQEEISNQLNLLQTYRQTLVHLLRQQAMFGNSHTPPSVWHDINNARHSIQSIKTALRQWGIVVEDWSIDIEEALPYLDAERLYEANQIVTLRGRLEVARLSDSTTINTSGYYFYLILEKSIYIQPHGIDLQLVPDAPITQLDEIQVATGRIEAALNKTVYALHNLIKSAGRTIVVAGELIEAHTAYHRTPYFIFAESIEIR